MEYRALYREARPEVFDEILGQDTIVKILKHQVETDTVSHAYLFTGTRGTGKTTTARVLAKAVNCLADDAGSRPCGQCENCRAIADGSFVDVVEIDAASNNGVDNIRELRESVNYPPVAGKKKVYIIDEVHMLSSGAFNALLKTLEEPPENVIFILATTNPEKLPQTVLSRCMRLDFRRVGQNVLAGHMKDLCAERGIEIDDDALSLLASSADGSVRDSLSILEQCLSSGEKRLTRSIVLDFLGAASEDFYVRFVESMLDGDIAGMFLKLDEALSDGLDVRQIMKDLMNYFRSLLIAKYVKEPEDMINMSSDNIKVISEQARAISLAGINKSITVLAEAINDARFSTQPRVLLEVALVDIVSAIKGDVADPAPEAARERIAREPAVQEQVAKEPVAQKQVAREPAAREQAPQEQKPQSPVPQDAPDAAGSREDTTARETEEAPQEDTVDASRVMDIWRDVCQEAEQKVPMLTILREIEPVGPKGGELKLPVLTELAKDKIEGNASLINGILKKLGLDAKVVCVRGGTDPAGEMENAGSGGFDDEDDGPDAEVKEKQRRFSEALGVEVEIGE